MRRWQTIFRTIWAIYLGFSVSSIDFLPIFRCFDIESFVESFSRMSNDTISNENVCSPLKRSWKKDMGDQISVKSNRILSVFSVLSTLFEEKKRQKKLPFYFFMSSLTFFSEIDPTYMLIFLLFMFICSESSLRVSIGVLLLLASDFLYYLWPIVTHKQLWTDHRYWVLFDGTCVFI